MSQHVPFRVTITLRTPACLNPDLTLDAVLAAALYRLDENLDRAHSSIPLKNTDGVWHGSTIQFLTGEHSGQPYVAKLSGRDFDPEGYSGQANRKGKIRINVGGGYLSPQLRRLPTFMGTIAFDGCGDPDQVQALLKSLPGIGKNVRQGLGRMAVVEIVPSDSDRSVQAFDGSPARPIPAETWSQWGNRTDTATIDEAAWKPPYWSREHREICALPPR